jgi:hypothetical protein
MKWVRKLAVAVGIGLRKADFNCENSLISLGIQHFLELFYTMVSLWFVSHFVSHRWPSGPGGCRVSGGGGLLSESSRRRRSLRFADLPRPSRGAVGLLRGESWVGGAVWRAFRRTIPARQRARRVEADDAVRRWTRVNVFFIFSPFPVQQFSF